MLLLFNKNVSGKRSFFHNHFIPAAPLDNKTKNRNEEIVHSGFVRFTVNILSSLRHHNAFLYSPCYFYHPINLDTLCSLLFQNFLENCDKENSVGTEQRFPPAAVPLTILENSAVYHSVCNVT